MFDVKMAWRLSCQLFRLGVAFKRLIHHCCSRVLYFGSILIVMSDETEVADEQKKPVKEILVFQDQGLFVHETADTYEGCFEIKKKDRYLKMHGPGVYKTAEGDIYTGTWEADRLEGDVTISYTDGSKYEGQLQRWCYNGRGKFTYPDGSVLTSDFVENSPMRNVGLTDPNGHLWLGHAENGYGWVQPWNHFYQELDRQEDTNASQTRYDAEAK